MKRGHPGWLDAAAAAALLGVTRPTLYAYVSRGFIRSQAQPGASRERRYSRDDVERLRRRTEGRRDPDQAAAHALQWGMPILESSIALIDGHRLYYRGHDVVALARARTVAEVAALVWTGRFDATFTASTRGPVVETGDLPFVARSQSVLARAGARDPLAFDLRPASVTHTGWRILQLLSHTATQSRTSAPAIEESLARAWKVPGRHADLIRGALILCADHELNVSSFAARCVASAGSHPYAVVIAGLSALEGTRHGGASARIESMLASWRRVTPLRGAVAARLKRGEAIEGFGHPLYRDGDPRAKAILAWLREGYPGSSELAFVEAVADAAALATREQPNLDFALAAIARVLRLPPGSPLTLFALGRTIGWIGHAIEQYATGQLIRPRAKYVGVPPAPPPGH